MAAYPVRAPAPDTTTTTRRTEPPRCPHRHVKLSAGSNVGTTWTLVTEHRSDEFTVENKTRAGATPATMDTMSGPTCGAGHLLGDFAPSQSAKRVSAHRAPPPGSRSPLLGFAPK